MFNWMYRLLNWEPKSKSKPCPGYELNFFEVTLPKASLKKCMKEDMTALREDLKRNGQQEPILVDPDPFLHDPPYRIVVGAKRFLALKALGRSMIFARFVGDVTNKGTPDV